LVVWLTTKKVTIYGTIEAIANPFGSPKTAKNYQLQKE